MPALRRHRDRHMISKDRSRPRFGTMTLVALVAAVPLATLAPTASAGVEFSLPTLVIDGAGVTPACTNVSFAVTAPWLYHLGAVQDPPGPPGATYQAFWFENDTRVMSHGKCTTTPGECHLTVADGSNFFNDPTSGGTVAGEYKGIPVFGG